MPKRGTMQGFMRNVLRLLAFSLLTLLPEEALAVNACPLSFLPCGAGGTVGLATYIVLTIFPAMRVLFIGVAVGMFFYYAGTLLIESGEEQKVSEVKGAYQYVITGAALVSLASMIVEATGTNSAAIAGAGGFIVNATACTILDNVITGLRLALATLVTVHITIQGIRLILLQGVESELEKQKKRFLYGLAGVAVLLLANPIVNGVMPTPGCVLGGGGPESLAQEISGVGNFLLTLLGAAFVLSIIVGGALLVVSTDDNIKERAKKTIFGSVVGLIIVLSAFVIVKYFLGL